MRQPKHRQRCRFERIGERTQESAEPRPPRHQLVIARIDLRVRDDGARQAIDQFADAAARVGAHVRREALAQRIGQIWNDWDIAEVIVAAPEKSMRLERPQPVRRKDDHPPAGPRHAQRLRDGGAIVLHVLDHLVQEGHVKRIGHKRKLLRERLGEARQMGLLQSFKLDVHSKRKRAVLRELVDIRADAAADVQHTLLIERSVLVDEAESSILSKAPDIAGMAERDGFVVSVFQPPTSNQTQKAEVHCPRPLLCAEISHGGCNGHRPHSRCTRAE